VLARYFGLGVVLLQVHLGERSGFGIPAPDKVLATVERKFLTLAPAAQQRQFGLEVRSRGRRLGRRGSRGGRRRSDLAGLGLRRDRRRGAPRGLIGIRQSDGFRRRM